MKFCSTCKEEFADKFSFCPVDGTPLNVLVSEPEEEGERGRRASFNSESVGASEPVLGGAVPWHLCRAVSFI